MVGTAVEKTDGASSARVTDLTVPVLDTYSQKVTNGTWCNWTHIVSADTHVAGEDKLVLTVPGTDISGYEVLISVSGFTGAFSAGIPN